MSRFDYFKDFDKDEDGTAGTQQGSDAAAGVDNKPQPDDDADKVYDDK